MNGLPPMWKSDRLKDVAIVNATSLPASTDPNYEFQYLEISNVDYFGIIDKEAMERLRFEDAPSRARRRVPPDSIVISSVRPNLQAVAFFPHHCPDLVCSTGFNVVQPRKHVLVPRFAYYVLISEYARQYFEAAATGVGYPAVGDKAFGSLVVPLPPLSEQNHIAAFLEASCSAIDAVASIAEQDNGSPRRTGVLNRQMETLLAYRKSLIHECVTGRRRITEADLKAQGEHE
jgi:type I restriction enzyme S subunit